MRWLAPVLIHPCSPSLSSCLPTQTPPPLLVRLRKVFGTWVHLAPFTFCYPSGNFFFLFLERDQGTTKSKKQKKKRASFSFLVLLSARVACLRLLFSFSVLQLSHTVFLTGGFSKASFLLEFQGSKLDRPDSASPFCTVRR
ncbi:hypothetical protein HDV63DRAFT_347641 [Trichoderma sp. SZMC 28014]